MESPTTTASPSPIRVFVHLARGFGASNWGVRWTRGEIIGINDPLPYGYFQAGQEGCAVEYSEDEKESPLGTMLRLIVRLLLGFDLVHAWRNRRGIRGADVVWTHTESQYLAVLLLLAFSPRRPRPKIIAQSVWLFDRWQHWSAVRRRLYAKLIVRADVLTVHSPENLKMARRLFPACRSEMIPFGIRADAMRPPSGGAAHRPIRVLSLGNDRHRDWATLVSAVKDWEGCTMRLVSGAVDRALLRNAPNVAIVRPKTNDDLLALYDWADIVVLALKPNLHASGITVVEEATLCGVPVICTDTGGLRAYFREDEVGYVPGGRPQAIRARIASLAGNDMERCAMVERAQARMRSAGLTSRRFAQRHVELSREILNAGGKSSLAAAGTPERRRAQAPPSYSRLARGAALALPCLAALAVTARLAAFGEAANALGRRLDLCRFRPTFSDDFDTLSVSPYGKNGSRWIAHTPWGGDFGDAVFADPRPGFPFRVDDGILEIEARKSRDGKWRSGLLASATPTGAGFAQRYGYFEVRAKLPPGPGLWPAFWLNSKQPRGSKEPGVEIDVIEYYGQFPAAYHSTVHVWDKRDPAKSRVEDHIIAVPPGSLTSAFHTYGADVEKDWITFYLDRRETWRTPTPPALRFPLTVLVNLALGGGWPIDKTPSPSIMQVDYVHVYARRPPAEASSCRSRDTHAATVRTNSEPPK